MPVPTGQLQDTNTFKNHPYFRYEMMKDIAAALYTAELRVHLTEQQQGITGARWKVL